jgi:site-specific DNA-methyltransferase (adenine-specific)
MRKEVIGDCVLYCGDSLEVMPTLDKVDLVVTDPPYLLTSGGNGEYADWQLTKDYDNSGKIVECDIDWSDFMPIIAQVLKEGTHCYTMCNNRHVQSMLNEAEKSGLKFHNLLVWDKMSCTPNRYYMKNLEFVGFFYKGHSKHLNNCSSQQLMACPQENYGDHPTTKPTALMEYYIKNSTQIGDVVLDPFMGVGSTGVGAIRSGRKFIGIEKDERYFQDACIRLEQAYRQGDMFSMPVKKYKQEGFI